LILKMEGELLSKFKAPFSRLSTHPKLAMTIQRKTPRPHRVSNFANRLKMLNKKFSFLTRNQRVLPQPRQLTALLKNTLHTIF
jgi:hypothetical protein